MKTIIAGSRSVTHQYMVDKSMKHCPWEITEVVSGTAKGVDQLGEVWAEKNSIPVKQFPAKWNVKGKLDRGAGYKRNTKMAEYADALFAIWDGESKGTEHMISTAEKKGLRVVVVKLLHVPEIEDEVTD